jgi:hypothetical protein
LPPQSERHWPEGKSENRERFRASDAPPMVRTVIVPEGLSRKPLKHS